VKIAAGQVAVVTEGTSGIGFALADHLIGALSGHDAEVVGVQTDVGLEADVQEFHAELRSQSSDLGATVLCPGLVDTALGSNSAALVPAGAAATQSNPGDRMPAGAMTPASVADATLAAVEAGRIHANVGPGTDQVVRQRVDGLLADLD
jgi:NAD(P)-dependent dehydrogenase (short-subunit alcohol dehydrogenase family)